MQIHCSVCRVPLEPHHTVFLDQLNTLTHQHCYSLETNLPIKDSGRYEQIIQQYEFFKENNWLKPFKKIVMNNYWIN